MSQYLTERVLGGLIEGNATKSEQQLVYKGIEELQAEVEECSRILRISGELNIALMEQLLDIHSKEVEQHF